MKKKILLTILFLMGLVVIAFAWTSSTPSFEWVSPVYTSVQTLTSPVKVQAIISNPAQGVDYANAWIFEDTDLDSVIDQTEWNARVQFPFFRKNTGVSIENINQTTSITLDYIFTDTPNIPVQTKTYFLLGVVKDLSGVVAYDTTLVVGQRYNGTIKWFSRFKITGYNP